MEWNYSEVDEDSNQNALSTSFNSETEVLQVLRQKLELPKGLCAQPEIFWEFFAPHNLWNELSRETRDELMAKHLPTFPADCCDDERLEKERTLQKLFARDKFNFNSSPLVTFQQNLEEGNYLTDVVSYRAKIARSERHEQRFQECEYVSRVASKLAESRKSFLDRAYNSSSVGQQSTGSTRGTFSESVAARARKRYLNELANFMSDTSLPLSDSEEEALLLCNYNNNNYNNNHSSSTNKGPRKPGRPSLSAATGTSHTMDLLTDTGESKIYGTFSYRPKYNSSGVVVPGESLPKTTQYNDEYVRQTLRRHKKRKTEDPDYRMARALPMYEYLMQDMFTSPASGTDTKSGALKSTNSRIKTESMKRDPGGGAAAAAAATEPTKMLSSETSSKPRVEVSRTTIGQPATKKLKISPDVNVEDASARPADPTIPDVPERMAVESTLLPLAMRQQIHACFMSLIRSIFCATPDHRTTFENLKQTVRAWLQSDKGSAVWFDDCHSWLDELPSVVKFLVGEFPEQPEDYVPYLEYKAPLRIYQWIGAGRDTDQHLLPLNRFWLEHRHEFGRASMPEGRKFVQPVIRATSTIAPPRINSDSIEDVFPPHRSPTAWLVRPERADEVATFRAQEKLRYENPSSPFTYRLHGYEVSVGPVSGVYAQVLNKGQNLLVPGRPHSVTIMSLVRDAISRLPNGEGSKAHVCELLKASQYLVPGSVMHGVVNTVIERLQKVAEGCVYFDPRRKVFVYTHRARTEADFRKQNLSTATFKKVVIGKSPVVVVKEQGGVTLTTAVDQKVSPTPPRVISRTGLGGSVVKMVVKGQPLSQGTTTPVAVGSPTLGISPTQQQNSVFQIRTSKASPVMITSTSGTPGMARPVSRVTVEQTRDIEANLDAKHPPALIPKLAYNKAPLKVVSGVAGVQSFQISGNQNRPMMSLLTNAQGQSVLMHNQRAAKAAGNQSVLISSSSNPPALVKSVAPRTSTMTVVPVPPKVVRPKANASPVAAAVTVMPKKTISISPATIAAAVKGNSLQKPIQICTSTGSVSPANGSVLRTAATSLLAGHKQMIQNIVIRSGSPQAQGTRTVPLSGAQSAGVKSIIVTNAAGGGDGSGVTSSGQNIIKIRTSSASNQQLTGNNTATVLPKTITTAGGAQFLQIHSTGGGGGQPQQFILNSVRQANSNTQAGSQIALKAAPGKQATTSSPHLVQLPAKTLIKGSPVTARVMKTVGSTSQGSVVSPNQSIVRTVQSRVMSTTTTSPVGQLVTLVDAAKGTHSTPIRIAKAGGGGGGTANVIQLAATNGTGAGTQYTVLSQGQSPARTQILNAKMVTQAGDGSAVGVKTGIRMLNAASITRLGAGKPVLISNKLPGNVTNLVRAATATAGVKVTPATVTSSSSSSPNTPQTTSLMIGGQQVKGSINLSGSTNAVVARSLQGTTTQHVMIGNQLVKIQSAGTVAGSGADRGKPVILNNLGQAYKVQSQGKLIKTTVPVGNLKSAAPGTGTANRVVLVQGPQGQLILPSNLQGGFKSLKMISVQPQVQQQQQQQQKASQQPK